MEKIVGIYKITNPKDKVYIGQSINIYRRWKQYFYLRRNCMGVKLYNSLCKYGYANHIFEIIEVCKVEELSKREIYYKKLFNCAIEGLNTKLEDDRHGPHSQETKDLISKKCKEAAKLKIYTDEWKENMKNKKTGHNCYKSEERNKKIGNAHAGKIISQETKDKIYTKSWYAKNIDIHKKQMKQIEQLDKEGNLINKWESITAAKKYTGIKGIGNVLTGRAKTAGGFLWKFI